jgi:WD40 repeat protein/DNA-binding SARP family transcriptional activator
VKGRTLAVEIRVLGRVDALVDGEPVPLGGSKPRAVLAILALRANRTVSTDDLIDGLWGDRPPASAAKNVQLYVSRLRKALDVNGSGASIITRGRGYELRLPADAVDAERFERLVERARRKAEQGVIDETVQGALELWQGAPLADVAEEPFAAPEIRRLEELQLRAVELAVDSELAAGHHDEVIGRLEALLAEYPLNERLHAQRMLALYRAGRQSEALDAYREATRTLINHTGVEPGIELRRLEEGILKQDPALDPPAVREELPAQLDGGSPVLAGRERELRWLRKRWEDAQAGRWRVALVSGATGIGKTRLAAELAVEVRRAGAAVRYAAGAGSAETALEDIQDAKEGGRPTLLVLDDADNAPPAVLGAAAALANGAGGSAVLLLALFQDEQGPPAFAALQARGTAQRLVLRPLRADAIEEIAALYTPADGVAMPLETLMAESQGVPLRVHRAASEWAQVQAAEWLEETVGKAAVDRGGLRAVESEVAGKVADIQVTRERTSLYVVEQPVDPSEPEVCPFRGLAPFDSAHAEYFFGRERLIAGLVARLVGSTLVAVAGPSGSGKSSVVRAGLLPALASGVLPGSERWRQVLMRPGGHPLTELQRALARLGRGHGESSGGDPLAAALHSVRPGERLVLAVDQLEELFTACRDVGERAAFVERLVTAAGDPDQRTVAVLAIRADFYGRCAEYEELSALMSANHVLVGPMRREELRRAIELPARRAGLRVEPRLVSALVGEIAEEPGGLPLLSTTLLELWEGRTGRTLRYSTYKATAGVSGAVARLAESAYRRLSEPQRERARRILLRLVDAEEPEPVRRRVPLSELEVERDEDAAGALAVLTESRLVTVDEGSVEVAHEALLREWPRLRGWLEEDAEGRRLHQHLIRAAAGWEGSGRDPGELYRGARLASALDWAEAHDPELNQLEREFLQEGRAASERETEHQQQTNRRLRALLAGVGVLLTIAVVAGLIARSQQQEAQSAATAEAAQRLGAQALTEDRLDRATLLAGAAVALDESLATRSSLLSTLVRNPAVLGILHPHGDELLGLALSPNGTLALGDGTGTVSLIDAETREQLGQHQVPGFIVDMTFDPRGEWLAVTTRYESRGGLPTTELFLHLFDAGTLRLRSSRQLPDPVSGPHSRTSYPLLSVAPDGRTLIVGFASTGIRRGGPLWLRRFDARSGSPLGKPVATTARSGSYAAPLLSGPEDVYYANRERTVAIDPQTLGVVRRYPVGGDSAGISADGETIAVGRRDGRVRLLDLDSGRVRALTGGHKAPVIVEAFAPNGRTLATGAEDGTVIVWDLREERATQTLEGHGDDVLDAVFSPDGRTLYSASADSTAIIWDVAGDRRLARPFTTGLTPIRDYYPPGFALAPDGRTLAVARLDGRVELIDAETLQPIGGFEAFRRFERQRTPAVAIEYSPDGRRLVVAGGRGLVGIWHAASGRQLGRLLHPATGPCAERPTYSRCFEATVQALAVGAGGLVAAAGIGGKVRIWDLGSRELTHAPLRLPRIVLGMAFSPDGSQLAIATGYVDSNPDRIEIRNPHSGERLARLSTENEVRSVAYSPDGALLAGGQLDGGVQLWATDGWERVGSLDLSARPTLGVAFSPDGRTLASSHDDGTVVLWDVESQEPIGSPLPGLGNWTTARFAPDGGRLFALSLDGHALRWEADPAAWIRQACVIAGGGLTPGEWEEIVPEQEYREVCPE